MQVFFGDVEPVSIYDHVFVVLPQGLYHLGTYHHVLRRQDSKMVSAQLRLAFVTTCLCSPFGPPLCGHIVMYVDDKTAEFGFGFSTAHDHVFVVPPLGLHHLGTLRIYTARQRSVDLV